MTGQSRVEQRARGQRYARLLDQWVTAPVRFNGAPGEEPITALYDQLVADGRHHTVTTPRTEH